MASENAKEMLGLDELAAIIGGRIRLGGYGILRGAILYAKQNELTREETLQRFKNSWAEDCNFKRVFTDRTDADLQEALDYIDKHW